jgi:hypothetical protein
MDCGPEDHPREPHSRPKQRAQTRCSLAAAVRLRVASEEMSGAEVVHTFVATMRPVGAIASWSDASLFGRVAGCRGADLPRLIEEPPEPRTLEMPRPATRAGLKHPAEGRGNSWT